MQKKLTDIGFIVKAIGFKGELVCALDQDLPVKTKFIFITLEGKPVPFFIEEVSEKNGTPVLKLEDVNDEAAAKKLTGRRMLIESARRQMKKKDVALNDLLNYKIEDAHYGSLGTISSLEEYPEQIIVRCIVNGKEILLPLHEDFILNIDESEKIVRLDLPKGLIDIYL